MPDLEAKINQIHWLKTIGVEYYFDEEAKKKSSHPESGSGSHEMLKRVQHDRYQPSKIPNRIQGDGLEVSDSRQLADSANNLEELKNYIINFDGCSLKKLANNTVFADGNPHSKIMLIGEAPGASEDAQGIPFCGESGKLLDNMLAAIGVYRKENAYITNTVFWRPPANRQPTQEEIDICRPFVEKHIALINPKLIILVGSTAATSLLGKHDGITKIRQGYRQYSNKYLTHPITLTAIFHPAYLLRQPMQKKTTWYDLIKIQQFITEKVS